MGGGGGGEESGSELAQSVPFFLSGFRLRVSYNLPRISEVRVTKYTYLGTCGRYGRGGSKSLSQKGFQHAVLGGGPVFPLCSE